MVEPGLLLFAAPGGRDEHGEPCLGIEADLPLEVRRATGIGFHQPVVTRTQERRVIQAGRAAGLPGNDVVPFAGDGGHVAARERAATVPGRKRTAQGPCEQAPTLPEVDNGALRREHEASQPRVTRDAPRLRRIEAGLIVQ